MQVLKESGAVGQLRVGRRTWPARFAAHLAHRECGLAADPPASGAEGARNANALDSAPSDLDCIARTRAGDSDAFGALVARYSARIYTHLFRLVRNRQEAEDLVQETFLRAFRFLNRFDTARSFRNWLYAIATNVGLNALRSRRRRGFPLPLDAGAARGAARDGMAGEDGRRLVAREELKQQLSSAIGRLPPRSAMLVHLHYHEGMAIREAAAIVGTSEGAAKVALCRARKSLREWLIEEAES